MEEQMDILTGGLDTEEIRSIRFPMSPPKKERPGRGRYFSLSARLTIFSSERNIILFLEP